LGKDGFILKTAFVYFVQDNHDRAKTLLFSLYCCGDVAEDVIVGVSFLFSK